MSTQLEEAMAALQAKTAGSDLSGTFKFEITDAGVLRIVDGEVVTGDGDADVTIRAPIDVFKEMFDGELSPTAAYMTGKITIDGDMSAAMKLGSLLA